MLTGFASSLRKSETQRKGGSKKPLWNFAPLSTVKYKDWLAGSFNDDVLSGSVDQLSFISNSLSDQTERKLDYSDVTMTANKKRTAKKPLKKIPNNTSSAFSWAELRNGVLASHESGISSSRRGSIDTSTKKGQTK